MNMALEVRFLRESERLIFRESLMASFGEDVEPDEELDARFAATFDTDLMIGAFDDGTLVGTCASFDLDLAVPGGRVAMAGTTVVSVAPTHRRRGVLTTMMGMHLAQARDRGQPVAGLWASEWPIYGRFGYGPAADLAEIEFDTRLARVAASEPELTLRLVTADEAERLVRPLFDDEFNRRPGMFSRSQDWWRHRVFLDHKSGREGFTKHRWVIAERHGVPAGYALYRQKLDWDTHGANGTVKVIELVATDDAARRSLWHHLSHLDLFPRVSWWNAPTDDPLTWLVTDPRRVDRIVGDALWLRILDVTRLLEARRYMGEADLAVGVTDALYPDQSNTYRIAVAGGSATVSTVDVPADVELDVGTLGALYLGGQRATTLAAAGRIDGSGQAVVELDGLFAWPVAPWTPEIF
jgi:predicted acetyltransferase